MRTQNAISATTPSVWSNWSSVMCNLVKIATHRQKKRGATAPARNAR
jgi:hypothetical protein